jgi:hypothetical protein
MHMSNRTLMYMSVCGIYLPIVFLIPVSYVYIYIYYVLLYVRAYFHFVLGVGVPVLFLDWYIVSQFIVRKIVYGCIWFISDIFSLVLFNVHWWFQSLVYELYTLRKSKMPCWIIQHYRCCFPKPPFIAGWWDINHLEKSWSSSMWRMTSHIYIYYGK